MQAGDILVKQPQQWRGQWQKYFGGQAPLFLEIGSGRGRFITTAAMQDPNHHYIALELREEMVQTSIDRLEGNIPPNLCFLWQDAAFLTEAFAPGEVERIYLHFSDPWPKRRHAKRRLTHRNFLAQYQEVLSPTGELILKTDSYDLFTFSQHELVACGWRLEEVDWAYHETVDPTNIPTEYELRFRRQGKPLYRLTARPAARKEPKTMEYSSTRGNSPHVTAGQAIVQGMVPGGGLFVPTHFPAFPYTWAECTAMTYQQLATEVFRLYLTDFPFETIQQMVKATYNEEHFDTPQIAPLVSLVNGLNILELWHGPTAAFKDMALQMLPRFLTYAAEENSGAQETVILVATSGDTGKAALEGFKNVPGVRVIVFYPDGGVSPMQRLQMCTTDGTNTHVVAVRGNFDDCQSAVKAIFNDEALRVKLAGAGKCFSSANSINWGRLLPQIVYYFYAYAQMLKKGAIQEGDAINITVPTGNFGNLLAAYYAKEMGLPVHRLICASNMNHVLADVLADGIYDCRRNFYKTTSPSMDILISSNFERFFYAMALGDTALVKQSFEALAQEGYFTAPVAVLERWQSILSGGYATEEEVKATIRRVFQETGYILDPHTAVAVSVYQAYQQKSGDNTPNIIASTASPFKFCRSVLTALTGEEPAIDDETALLEQLAEVSKRPVHQGLAGLTTKPVLHQQVIEIAAMPQTVLELLHLA